MVVFLGVGKFHFLQLLLCVSECRVLLSLVLFWRSGRRMLVRMSGLPKVGWYLAALLLEHRILKSFLFFFWGSSRSAERAATLIFWVLNGQAWCVVRWPTFFVLCCRSRDSHHCPLTEDMLWELFWAAFHSKNLKNSWAGIKSMPLILCI